MIAGVVVTTQLGVSATVFYLFIYVVMNMGAFAVISARERETGMGDDISTLYGLGESNPWLAWPMTISMLALAGFPATAGFFGKVYLIQAAFDNGYGWLGIVIVLGSAVSLAYYLRVVAAVWMRPGIVGASSALAGGAARPVIAGGSAEADEQAYAAGLEPGETRRLLQPEVIFVAVVCAAATIFFGIYPSPLHDVAVNAGQAFTQLF